MWGVSFYVYGIEEKLLVVIGCNIVDGPCSRPMAGTGFAECFQTHKANRLFWQEILERFFLLSSLQVYSTEKSYCADFKGKGFQEFLCLSQSIK